MTTVERPTEILYPPNRKPPGMSPHRPFMSCGPVNPAAHSFWLTLPSGRGVVNRNTWKQSSTNTDPQQGWEDYVLTAVCGEPDR